MLTASSWHSRWASGAQCMTLLFQFWEFILSLRPSSWGVIGDVAYELGRNLWTPYRGTPRELALWKRAYNKQHSRGRMPVSVVIDSHLYYETLTRRWRKVSVCLKFAFGASIRLYSITTQPKTSNKLLFHALFCITSSLWSVSHSPLARPATSITRFARRRMPWLPLGAYENFALSRGTSFLPASVETVGRLALLVAQISRGSWGSCPVEISRQ